MPHNDEEFTADDIVNALQLAFDRTKYFMNRFVIDDEAFEGHPERDAIVTYLKARSWRGTEAGACDFARVSLKKLDEWRASSEFQQWEKYANEACTDLLEETLVLTGVSTGDRKTLERALEGRRENYVKRSEVTGKGGGPVQFAVGLGGVPRPERIED